MTDETQECIDRLAALFSLCLSNPAEPRFHTWDLSIGECAQCKAPFPYLKESNEQP